MQNGLWTPQLLLIGKRFFPALVLIHNELANCKLVSIMQSQIISPQFPLLNDAQINSSKLQKEFKNFVCLIDNGNHEQSKALSSLGIDRHDILLFIDPIYLFKQHSQAVHRVEL